MASRRLHLVRHGVTEWNRDGRFQGHIDVPLSDLGRQQAAAAGERISQLPVIHCIASDLSRAFETAQIIGDQIGLEVTSDPDLREANKGKLEGKQWDPTTQLLGDESGYHNELDLDARPPGGESMMDVRRRCLAFLSRLETLDSRLPSGDILIVGHGGTLRMLLADLLELSPESSRIFRFDNCSLTTVEQRVQAPPLLATYNDTYHLQRAELFWSRVEAGSHSGET